MYYYSTYNINVLLLINCINTINSIPMLVSRTQAKQFPNFLFQWEQCGTVEFGKEQEFCEQGKI